MLSIKKKQHSIVWGLVGILVTVFVAGGFWYVMQMKHTDAKRPSVSALQQQETYKQAIDSLIEQVQQGTHTQQHVDAFLFETRVPAAYTDGHLALALEITKQEQALLALLTTYRSSL